MDVLPPSPHSTKATPNGGDHQRSAQEPPHILDLRGTDSGFSLKDELASGLRDGQPLITPGETPEDKKFAYTRSIHTLCLYSDRGLEIYEEITKLEDYYVFPAELEILKEYGAEIACRMFGLPSEALAEEYERTDEGSGGWEYETTPAANGGAPKEKWGDSNVGRNNAGVNGEASARVGLAIELGSGSLAKTKHLLQPLAKLLKGTCGTAAPFASIEYKALDVEPQSLISTLTKLAEHESKSVTAIADDSRRVVASGIAATYDEGLAHLAATAPPEEKETKSLLWLGSSIGNFSRPEAAEFLKNITTNVLAPGDTMVLGVDNADDAALISRGYDDPQGVTKRFILEGVDNAGRSLHGVLDGDGGLASKNFKYISRWNATIGRHEAYVQCKVDFMIPLPTGKVVLKKNEMVRIEVSYKYTQLEAQELFDAAGLRLVQRWTDSRNLHSIYIVERPSFHFPLHHSLAPQTNPYGLPSLKEWETMWVCWDTITLGIIPQDLLLTKPIPLRHIILFYLGHIPAFAGIHLCRYFGEAPFEPARFAQIFERGIDPDVAEPTVVRHWHSKVPDKTDEWPSLSSIIAYQNLVRDRIRKVYEKDAEMTQRLARVMFMIFEHEAMHAETLVYIALQAANSLKPAPGFEVPDFKSLSRFWDRQVKTEGAARRAILSFEATSVALGHDDREAADAGASYDPAHEMGWDCENPRRELSVPAFKISALPVSNAEYLDWLQSLGAKTSADLLPSSWTSSDAPTLQNVRVKTLYGEICLEYAKHWPVSASAKQLTAFAKARGGRLPTQGEMAVVHRQSPVDSAMGNVGFQNLHPVPPTAPHAQRDGSVGFGSDGGVWQWTSTVLDAQPGFEPSTIYPGYSSDFHDGTHLIVVGGSYVTPPRLARTSFVNFYQAGYPDVLAGARIVYD